MTYIVEDLENYGNQLHINTVLTILFNTLSAYLILKHSTPIMGVYKYYILSTVIFAFLMDFHVTFIYGMFPLYPHLGACPAGISKHLGHFWGNTVQYGIFHFTLMFCSLSIFFGFLYQYFSITITKHFLQTTRGGICIGLFMLIYPLPTVIVYFLNNSYENVFERLKIIDPKLIDFFVDAECIGFSVNEEAYLGTCVLQTFLVFIATLIMVRKIIKKLSSQKHQMSANTLKMRRQYFRVLIIQCILPMIFLVLPILLILVMFIFDIKNLERYNQLCFQFMSLHSVANALAIMCVIKSYRRILFQWISKIFCSRKKNSINSTNKITFVQ